MRKLLMLLPLLSYGHGLWWAHASGDVKTFAGIVAICVGLCTVPALLVFGETSQR